MQECDADIFLPLKKVHVKNKTLQVLSKILFLLLVFSPFYGFKRLQRNVKLSTVSQRQMIGAELYANCIEPGKLTITLQVFYSTSIALVPEIETVRISEKESKNLGKHVELKKQKEVIDVKYDLVEGFQSRILPSIKSVVYTGTFETGLAKKSYDVSWISQMTTELLNNIAANSSYEKVVLMVHIADATVPSYNNVPFLNRLPVLIVVSNQKTTNTFDINEVDFSDILEVTPGIPMILNGSKESSKQSQITNDTHIVYQNVDYRKGFSPELPAGNSFKYKKETREFVFEKLSPGNYLFALTIIDYKNQQPVSQHQAVFIIESIL